MIKNGIDIMKRMLQKYPRTGSNPFSADASLQVGHASAVVVASNTQTTTTAMIDIRKQESMVPDFCVIKSS
jgi:hypothetical protein